MAVGLAVLLTAASVPLAAGQCVAVMSDVDPVRVDPVTIRANILAYNQQFLSTSVTLPHDVFLAGENIYLDVRIENRAARKIEVFDPFDGDYRPVVFRLEGNELRPLVSSENCGDGYSRKSIALQAGEAIERRLPIPPIRAAGQYSILYSAGTVSFRVIAAALRPSSEVGVPGLSTGVLTTPDGLNIIVASPWLLYQLDSAGFNRIFETRSEISELRVSLDSESRFRIAWKSDGAGRVVRLDRNLNIVD